MVDREELLNVTTVLAAALVQKAGNQVMLERLPDLIEHARDIIDGVDKFIADELIKDQELQAEMWQEKQILMEKRSGI